MAAADQSEWEKKDFSEEDQYKKPMAEPTTTAGADLRKYLNTEFLFWPSSQFVAQNNFKAEDEDDVDGGGPPGSVETWRDCSRWIVDSWSRNDLLKLNEIMVSYRLRVAREYREREGFPVPESRLPLKRDTSKFSYTASLS